MTRSDGDPRQALAAERSKFRLWSIVNRADRFSSILLLSASLMAFTGYEFLYRFTDFTWILLILFILIICMLFFRSGAAGKIAVVIGVIAATNLAPQFFFVIDNARIIFTDSRNLPQRDGDIVEWGGDGTFQSDRHFYLWKSSSPNEQPNNESRFTYILGQNCAPRFRKLNSEYILIRTVCG